MVMMVCKIASNLDCYLCWTFWNCLTDAKKWSNSFKKYIFILFIYYLFLNVFHLANICTFLNTYAVVYHTLYSFHMWMWSNAGAYQVARYLGPMKTARASPWHPNNAWLPRGHGSRSMAQITPLSWVSNRCSVTVKELL